MSQNREKLSLSSKVSPLGGHFGNVPGKLFSVLQYSPSYFTGERFLNQKGDFEVVSVKYLTNMV